MKKVITLMVVTMLIVSSGCSSTVTLGVSANKDAVLDASVSTKKVSVTLPLVKAAVQAVPLVDEKSKK